MNKTEFIERVAEKAGVNKKQAAVVVDATFDSITSALQEGDRVQLVGFGTFETRQRSARIAKNPKTGEAVEVAATVAPVFKPGKVLKKAVN